MISSLLLPLLLVLSRAGGALAQQARPKKPLPSLGDTLHLTLDKDKNGKVTMEEVNEQLVTLNMLFAGSEGDEGEEYRQLIAGVKKAAPQLFELLDSNGDKKLSKGELAQATRFEKSLKKEGGMRELLRDVFGMLDADGDDQLSPEELLDAIKSDEMISKVTVRFHKLFPLRKTAEELESFVKDTITSIGGDQLDKESVVEGMRWIDDNADGLIQRVEVGKHYNAAGKKFLEIAKTIKQMGPMLAMFGGMDSAGGGGGGGGFKMDL
ncbi:hypothetical protein ACHAXT_000117 [Thalassiosira profunda]